MTSTRLHIFLILIFCLCTPLEIHSRGLSGEKSAISLDKYNINQYISTAGSSPKNIIDMDNNGDILMACVAGKTIDQMKAMQIDFTESQIRLLKDWRLLSEENSVLKTAFSILDSKKTGILRGHSKKISSKLGPSLKDGIIKLADELESLNRKNNIYTLLFSYVIGGLVWDRFIEQEMLGDRVITAEMPFWSGTIWALYPPRDFSCGTNSISNEGVSLKVNWSENTIKNMIPFVADWKNFGRMFDDFVQKRIIEDEEAVGVFAPFNLFDETGRFTIPIIEEKDGDSFYEICLSISEKVVDELSLLLSLSGLKEEFGFQSEEETLVIVYHEIMWDLLDYLEEKDLIKKPVAFSRPDKTESEDIADLVFFVIGGGQE